MTLYPQRPKLHGAYQIVLFKTYLLLSNKTQTLSIEICPSSSHSHEKSQHHFTRDPLKVPLIAPDSSVLPLCGLYHVSLLRSLNELLGESQQGQHSCLLYQGQGSLS